MRDNTTLPSSLRVLVVDDWPDTVETMAALVRLWGHDVRIAHDGGEALDVAAAYHPHVVLLDVSLPGMDGYQVAQRLRRDPGREQPFMVSVTGHGQDSDVQRSLEAGFDRHLLKPVDPDTLHDLLACRRNMQEAETEEAAIAEPAVPPPALPPIPSVIDRAEHRLRSHPYLALKNVSCDFHDGVLILHGWLPTYYLKQLAQAAVMGIEEVQQVRNEIQVSSFFSARC
jgi:CheY-like chemotaxis protein